MWASVWGLASPTLSICITPSLLRVVVEVCIKRMRSAVVVGVGVLSLVQQPPVCWSVLGGCPGEVCAQLKGDRCIIHSRSPGTGAGW
ncbi:hypothetical protein B0T22DRAFT_467846 [Podospora appendiculata]|uniref:Uncharacterized protein n=1 Tax=Podospora appendiculata TaxID=314037 RepID=A0AAE1C8U8_9PEZI|nr:hypothetical protein B0T22DRAFT_467846 [Podospora appendiculata]